MPSWHPWATLRIQDGRQDGGDIKEKLFSLHIFYVMSLFCVGIYFYYTFLIKNQHVIGILGYFNIFLENKVVKMITLCRNCYHLLSL